MPEKGVTMELANKAPKEKGCGPGYHIELTGNRFLRAGLKRSFQAPHTNFLALLEAAG